LAKTFSVTKREKKAATRRKLVKVVSIRGGPREI
jgi:hypothetical protein